MRSESWSMEEVWKMQFRGRSQLQAISPCSSCKHFDPSSITVIGLVGTGSFGKVYLIQREDFEHQSVMKSLEKSAIEKSGHFDHCLSERRILASIRFPFIVKYEGHFQTRTHLHILMEFVQGQELFRLLHHHKSQEETGFGENICRFYLSEVLLSLEYLHSLGIVYRDLKLENIMVDREGHVKIIDFGFCKKMITSKTMCGTPDYLAPEVFDGNGYGKGVDWWAFGVLAFELRSGCNPFHPHEQDPTERLEEIQANIKAKDPLHFPRYFEPDLIDLIEKLLEYSPAERLGVKGKVRFHPWFQRVDFEKALKRGLNTPEEESMKRGLRTLTRDEPQEVKEVDTDFLYHDEMLNENSNDCFRDF